MSRIPSERLRTTSRGSGAWTSARWTAWEAAPAITVLAVVALVSVHALRIKPTLDFGLAYRGGEVAWETGRPESLETWISTPFLGMVMAVISRVISESTGAKIWTGLNLLLYYGGLCFIWLRLRQSVRTWLWWVTLLGAAGFAPAISSIWWKQFNLAALALAAFGYNRLRSEGRPSGSWAIAASLLIKPLVILLPLALLAGRGTRQAGYLVLGWLAGLLAVAQGFMVWRAHSFEVALPIDALQKFAEKSRPEAIWVCHAENFSPQSMLCRLAGTRYWTMQRGVVTVGVLLLGLIVLERLRHHPYWSWELFGFACLLSPMISPIAWSHYQVLCLPLLLVVAIRLGEPSAPQSCRWLFVGAFLLFELVWQPAGTLLGTIRDWLEGTPEDQQSAYAVFAIAMFAQYVLCLLGLLVIGALPRGDEASVPDQAPAAQ